MASRKNRLFALPTEAEIEFALQTGTDIFLPLRTVSVLTSLSVPTIKAWRREGRFPQPIRLSDGPCSPIAWRHRDIKQWQQDRVKASSEEAD